MSWSPISLAPIQYMQGNPPVPASGYILKAYIAGTTTVTPMATDDTGSTTFNEVTLNSEGRPEHSGAEVIPHIDRNYKLSLFATQAAADANTPAVWSFDDLNPVAGAGVQTVTDAVNNDVTQVQTLEHQTSGIPANGIGAGLLFKVETSPNNVEEVASIEAVSTDVTLDSEDFDLVFKVMTGGATKAEVARFNSSTLILNTSRGLTAGTTQTQGGATAMTASINEFSTVANANDGGALPDDTAIGERVMVVNNGANALKVWPATGDNINSGSANAADSETIAAGGYRIYTKQTATKWSYEIDAGVSITRSARTSNTILGTADSGTLIDVTSGTFTQTITAAATLGDGWFVYYKNSGTGVVTLDPNSTETIGGAATLALARGDWVIFQCDGSNFNIVARGNIYTPANPLISTTTLSSDSTIDLTLPSGFDDYEIRLVNVIPSDDTAIFYIRTSTDGGSTFDSTAGHYSWAYTAIGTGGAADDDYSASDQYMRMLPSVGSDANESGVNVNILIENPAEAIYTRVSWIGSYANAAGGSTPLSGSGERKSAADVDAIRLLLNGGTFESGTVYLYGKKRAA